VSREIIESFYRAFARRDATAMAALYADDVRFSDPAFGPLTGEHARNMWRMLAERATDLDLVFSASPNYARGARARWLSSAALVRAEARGAARYGSLEQR
jgi:hypothetical protein